MPYVFVDNEILTAKKLNDHCVNPDNVGDNWQAYTPTLTNVNLGTAATLIGKWCRVGNVVHMWVIIVFGTGPSVTGTIGVSLPVPGIHSGYTAIGQATFWDQSATGIAARRIGHVVRATATNTEFWSEGGLLANATQPWAWAAGDSIRFSATYEVAG